MSGKQFVKGAESVSRFEIKRYGYTLTLEISPDEQECYCYYEPSTIGGTPLTYAELQAHLAQFKINDGVVPEAVSSLLNSAVSAKSVSRLFLARGIPMIPGEDGHIAIGVSDELAEAEPEEGAGIVDFRRVQAFLNVDAGELVATIISPGPGTPGKTVTGKTVPPLAGAPVKLEIGQNVRLSDDGLTVLSLATGRVCLRENVISVEDVYEIDGNVDFKVGNVAFKGYVEVKGDVLDGFFVKATKGIKVRGNIGVCTIESDGDISFCGMSGQGTGKVLCGGSITANFISDAVIECAGDVTAEVEIRSSHIKCLGAISVNKGGLTGGEYFALAGVECANLGSRTALRTRVVAGVHYADLEELNCLFNELKALVAEFTAAPKGTVDMKAFAQKRALVTERTQEVRSRIYEQCNPKINVKKVLYEGVSITLGMISDNILEERKGPVSIIENSIEGGFRFLGMTPLSFKAHMIEQTFKQQQQLEQQRVRSNIQEAGA
ncbi:MAG: FapA family protein [Desulfuromonadaceae bacterium]|nr:FapA family protein [Desulfuromonadaceae bacterium]MDD2849757.1 FapA family protein [Desulfuromonadaceae bacterium]MDD4130743.1 FapA family protein [Desulfuromonadaceae bacterium]